MIQLKQEGYTGVVNLRNDGEPDQPLSTADEGTKGPGAGDGLPASWRRVGALDRPGRDGRLQLHRSAFARNRKGARSLPARDRVPSHFYCFSRPATQKWTNAEVFAKGKEMGLDLEGGLKMMVDHFLQDTTC